MRVSVLQDYLAQTPPSAPAPLIYGKPKSPYFVAARVFTGAAQPAVRVPVQANMVSTGGLLADPPLITDDNGVIVYPVGSPAIVELKPVPPEGFFPTPTFHRIATVESGDFDPNDFKYSFTITKGRPPLSIWEKLAIGGVITAVAYFVLTSQKK
jgi:hypothetical protein